MTNAPLIEAQSSKRLPVQVSRLKTVEAAWRSWALTVEDGTTRADLLRPEYWARLAPKLAPRDRVQVIDESETWLGEYFVRLVGGDQVRVIELWFAPLEAAAAPAMPVAALEVRWRGYRHKWSVVQTANNAVIRAGMESREEAEQFIRDNPNAKAA